MLARSPRFISGMLLLAVAVGLTIALFLPESSAIETAAMGNSSGAATAKRGKAKGHPDERQQPPRVGFHGHDALQGATADDCSPTMCLRCSAWPEEQRLQEKCCAACSDRAEDPKVCDQRRDEYRRKAAPLLEELGRCEKDDDCVFASLANACVSHCPRSMNKYVLGTIGPRLRDLAAQACQPCARPPFECPTGSAQDVTCNDGRCATRR